LLFLLKRIGHLLAQDKIVHALFFQLKFEHLKFFLPLACLFFFWLLNRLRLISFSRLFARTLLPYLSNRLEALLSRTRLRLSASAISMPFNITKPILSIKVLKRLIIFVKFILQLKSILVLNSGPAVVFLIVLLHLVEHRRSELISHR
jgi:hypothetical protein